MSRKRTKRTRPRRKAPMVRGGSPRTLPSDSSEDSSPTMMLQWRQAALEASLSGTTWANAIEKSREKESGTGTSSYTVAQYNFEFEFNNRVNEIRMPFDLEDASSV
ncbi:hypothetical protein ACJRO7_023356 [Eucalyptus globulus]|uniref:Uncharacterized protein n=1 Tax=Eucalyptus globulus TaxID=34317 RepID=A0ABD3K2S0_EUCGL